MANKDNIDIINMPLNEELIALLKESGVPMSDGRGNMSLEAKKIIINYHDRTGKDKTKSRGGPIKKKRRYARGGKAYTYNGGSRKTK